MNPRIGLLCGLAAASLLTACQQIDDDRIPRMPVNIEISDQGMWNIYGVSGFGSSRRFILGYGLREPGGFPYNTQSSTGYGGVLLIEGQNVFSGSIEPLAYDLSCPVERMPNDRVEVHPEMSYDAVCPTCGSHYNVVEAGGTPTEGPALDYGYALRRYSVYGTVNGGYIITDY